MSKKQVGLKFGPEFLAQIDAAAEAAGCSRQAMIDACIERSLPGMEVVAAREVVAAPRSSGGAGQCPERGVGEGHVWESWRVDERKPCKFCGKSGREFFDESTRARSALFSGLRQPDSVKGVRKSGGS